MAQARSKDYVEEATWRQLLVPLGAIFGIVLVIVGVVVLKDPMAGQHLLANIYELLGNTAGAEQLRNNQGDVGAAKVLLAIVAIVIGVGGVWLVYTGVSALVGLLPPRWQGRILPWVFVVPAMALDLLHPPSPSLVAVGGFSGSGKSTLALALAPSIAPVPGAVVLRSDEIRKQLCGVEPLQPLGPEGYTPEISARVYETIVERARVAVRCGHSVIADAVHARQADREAIERVAADASVGALVVVVEVSVVVESVDVSVDDESVPLAGGAGALVVAPAASSLTAKDWKSRSFSVPIASRSWISVA